MTKRAHLTDLLARFESTLQSTGLWSKTTPSPEALASPLPFCYDTLSFEQWLQFVFVVKMRALLASTTPLPTKVALTPMAEQVYGETNKELAALFQALSEIDALLNEEANGVSADA